MMKISTNLFGMATIICSILGIAFSATAADTDKKAVSEPNMTLDLSGGSKDGNGNASIGDVITVPLNDDFGLQIDSLYSKTANIDAGGIGGHYFYRDPESYLIGATALWYNSEGNDLFRYGLESEYYLEDFTFVPSAGFQTGGAVDGNKGYYGMDVSYYLNDNLKFTVTGEGYSDVQGASGEVEWQPMDDTPITTYITAGDSEVSKAFALIGIRYNFGSECESLKYRNRHSDPKNIVNAADKFMGASIVENSGNNDNGGGGGCCMCEGPTGLEDAHEVPACCPCAP
jgi:hypothetical protein